MDYDRPIHPMTEAARAKGWEIFSPQWDFLSQHPALSLSALCAMSVGLHPFFANASWVFNEAIPYFDGSKHDLAHIIPPEELEAIVYSGPHEAHVNALRVELLNEFLRRIHIATANLPPRGALPVALGEPVGESTLVRVTDFVTWAEGMGWNLPEDFPRAVQKSEVENVENRWPWGNYETELLKKLAKAADRFWTLYDPADNTTAPKNQQVIEWLQRQGVPERTAQVMATILRADGLPTGPRK